MANRYSQTSPLEAFTRLGQGLKQGIGDVMQNIAAQQRQTAESNLLGQAFQGLMQSPDRESLLENSFKTLQNFGEMGVSADANRQFMSWINQMASVTPTKEQIEINKRAQKEEAKIRDLKTEKLGFEVGILGKEYAELVGGEGDNADKSLQYLYGEVIQNPQRWSPEVVREAAIDAGLDETTANTLTAQANADIKITPVDELAIGALKNQHRYTEEHINNIVEQLKLRGVIPQDAVIPMIDRTAKEGTIDDLLNKAKLSALAKVFSDYAQGFPIEKERLDQILNMNAGNLGEIFKETEIDSNNEDPVFDVK